ncbi:MAG: acyl-CoA dehydrogenase family protein [Candidatus Melainabacteria bacterium]|nr:acyl-CoA dehydrogenase family protein [Candidatus Melainabacteria bacterium]
MATHTVFNQAKALVGYNMFDSDALLKDLIKRYGAEWAEERLKGFGAFAGSAFGIGLAIDANTNLPVLKTHSRFGERIDQVDFHPSYHNLMAASIEAGAHSLPWTDRRDGAHVARAALLYMAFQNEAGHCCPISMTYSAIPALRKQPELAKVWEPLITSTKYDSRFIPFMQKTGVTIGMGMTEKQGGSDVRANTTMAVPVGAGGAGSGAAKEYLLTGHKWFCSAPMSDAFLILAQTEKGPSCFLVPRFKPNGEKNAIFIQRLKDKMGNKSNASSEIELENALGFLVGDEGRGVPTIIEMVNHTRLDCIISSAALMRQATLQAMHHCHHRSAFGKVLSEQPLMVNVLADLALESEAALRLTMRVARSYDQAQTSAKEAQFKRIVSAIAKYWVCKRAPMAVAEALECFGGNGYVEEGPMPRLFRESPLLGIWEGSGNVICLDVLRAVSTNPNTLDVVVEELDSALGINRRYDMFVASVKHDIKALKTAPATKAAAAAREKGARRFVERLALAMQASLMLKDASEASAKAFVASRLTNAGGYAFGTLPAKVDAKKIMDDAYPAAHLSGQSPA